MRAERAVADGRTDAWPVGFVQTERDREAMLVLASIPGLTARRLHALADRAGAAGACLDALRAGRGVLPDDRRSPAVPLAGVPPWAADRRVPPVDPDLAASLSPDGIRERLRECGARMVFPGEPDYPASILDLHDPPATLFVRGSSPSEASGGVAIVGARNCSPLGEEIAARFGRELASAGVPVVSGGARGIDAAAHRGSLDAGGPTVAVLGSGIDVAYPSGNGRLLERVAAAGALVSEYPPGVPAMPFRFPARNRIVAALAEAVLVVEGAAGSGSLITADHALDLGRPVFAVPGAVTSPLSEVPLALIRDGAGLVRNAEDLLADLGRLDPTLPDGRPRPGGLSELERRLLERLSGPTLPEVLAAGLETDLGGILAAVVGLEVRGLVRMTGGRVERRLGAPGPG